MTALPTTSPTAERPPLPRPSPRWWLALSAVALGGAALAYFFLVARAYHLDLTIYRDATRWWWEGHDPYRRLYSVHHLAFTYPPFALLALAPVAALPAGLASFLWFVVNVAAVAATCYVVLRTLGAPGSADLWLAAIALSGATVFLLEPVRSTLDYGQVNAVIMAGCTLDMLWPRLRYRGVLVGVAAAVKLTPLAFLLFFAVRRDGRALVRGVVAFATGTALAWLVLPGPSHAFWTKLVWDPERTGKLTYPGNLSWDAVFVRSGLHAADARHLWLLAAVITVAVGTVATARCVRAGSDAAAVLMVAITGLLVSPVSWSHHWIWLVVAVPLVASRTELRVRLRLGLAGLLLLAAAAPYWWFSPGGAASVAEAVMPVWAFAVLVVASIGNPRPATAPDPGPRVTFLGV